MQVAQSLRTFPRPSCAIFRSRGSVSQPIGKAPLTMRQHDMTVRIVEDSISKAEPCTRACSKKRQRPGR